MASNRHLGRIIVLQTLYEQEMRESCDDKSFNLDEVLERNIKRYRKLVGDSGFIKDLVKGVDKVKEDIDKMLQPIAPDWPIDEIARMDRLILRIGCYELLHFDDVPPRVTINEAVELAKSFGAENSSKFINGVLGTFYKENDIVGKEESETKAPKKDQAEKITPKSKDKI
jgi:transcription antitermination protein NusB